MGTAARPTRLWEIANFGKTPASRMHGTSRGLARRRPSHALHACTQTQLLDQGTGWSDLAIALFRIVFLSLAGEQPKNCFSWFLQATTRA